MKISSEVAFRGELIHQHSSQTGIVVSLQHFNTYTRLFCFLIRVFVSDSLSGVIQCLDALQADSNAFLGTRVDFDKANGLYGASTNAKMSDDMSDASGGEEDESVSGDDQSTSDSAPPLKKKK
jgi:hypothetical protein